MNSFSNLYKGFLKLMINNNNSTLKFLTKVNQEISKI